MRSWQDILYNLHYRKCRATKYQRNRHVACQFYSNKFFCIWWNEGAIPYEGHVQAARAAGNCLEALKPNTIRWFSSSFSLKTLFLHTAASISQFFKRSGSITVSWLTSKNSTTPSCVSSSLNWTLTLALTSCILTRRFCQLFGPGTDILFFRFFVS